MKFVKRIRVILIGLLVVSILLSGCTTGWLSNHDIELITENSFVDSMGNEFVVDEPYERVVSLYSAHTENAFAIGAGSQIIGASTTSVYPPEAASLPRYDYKSDPEPLIAAAPDLVIIRPFINRNYPDYVRAIEKAGIPVVSLYPKDRASFDVYAKALGILLGRTEEVTKCLAELQAELDSIVAMTEVIPEEERVTAYFESTKAAYRTVTVDSPPAVAIEMAGGINIASHVKPVTRGSTIADYGIEKLMINAEEIEVFISQRGAMNAGGSLISIPQREGFMAIKAVANNRILELNEKLISSPTFRYSKGVMEMARMFYPERIDTMTAYNHEQALTRRDYANLTVRLYHTPIFIPSSSHYYEKKHLVHTYGLFKDVSWQDADFDYIETAVQNSYLKEIRRDDGLVYFKGETLVTRADIAYTLYIVNDIKGVEDSIEIKDLDQCVDQKIVQKVVDAGYMSLDSRGLFNPDVTLTGREVIDLLEQGKELQEAGLWSEEMKRTNND